MQYRPRADGKQNIQQQGKDKPMKPNTGHPAHEVLTHTPSALEQQLLVEMAEQFNRLERLPVWPLSVRQHCEAWATLMKLELQPFDTR